MDSSISGTDSSLIPIDLPPMICVNVREKVLPEEVPINEIIIKSRMEKAKPEFSKLEPPAPQPVPLHPLSLAWSPEKLHFEIKEEPIVQRLRICNSCARTIYVHCCQLWDETAYLGARWGFHPKTRFLLAPGLTADLYLRAYPKELSPVHCVCATLQLAAAHKRDHVTGYFAVPVVVKFLNFTPEKV